MLASGLDAIDHGAVLEYLALRRDRCAQEALNIECKALRAFARWRFVAGLDPADTAAQVPRQRRAPERVVRWLTDAEVGTLLAAPDLSTYVGFRDHVMMATLYQAGLRASELVALELGSVVDSCLLVRNGKGNRARLVPVSSAHLGLLDSYVRIRRTVRPGKRSALFLTQHGQPFSSGRAVWVIVDRYAHVLGIGCGYQRLRRTIKRAPWSGHYPHVLRASFATALLHSGCDVVSISQMLGHSSADTTARYLGIDLEFLRAQHAKLRG